MPCVHEALGSTPHTPKTGRWKFKGRPQTFPVWKMPALAIMTNGCIENSSSLSTWCICCHRMAWAEAMLISSGPRSRHMTGASLCGSHQSMISFSTAQDSGTALCLQRHVDRCGAPALLPFSPQCPSQGQIIFATHLLPSDSRWPQPGRETWHDGVHHCIEHWLSSLLIL